MQIDNNILNKSIQNQACRLVNEVKRSLGKVRHKLEDMGINVNLRNNEEDRSEFHFRISKGHYEELKSKQDGKILLRTLTNLEKTMAAVTGLVEDLMKIGTEDQVDWILESDLLT